MSVLVKVSNLTKSFKGSKVVDDVSFETHSGQIFGLLGPNGAGKTTTIRIIATLLSPSFGTAEVAGFNISKDPENVRKNIGVLTTDIGAYDRLSGRENLKYFGSLYNLNEEEINESIEKLVKLLEMDWFIDNLAGTYSTGMKQKLAIARSVIHDPKVIIFDEPTTGLDVLASQTVLSFIKLSKEKGKSVILSTHQMYDVERLCDKVLIINKGRILTTGSVSEIEKETKSSNLEDAFLKLVKLA